MASSPSGVRSTSPCSTSWRSSCSPRISGRRRARSSSAGLAARPSVVLMLGVNGSGKTTSTGKLAAALRQSGKGVLLAAADTFRAAAVEQLEEWGRRSGTEVIRQGTGADPAAVVFDAVKAAMARRIDVLLVDTAGRLHTKSNLMD